MLCYHIGHMKPFLRVLFLMALTLPFTACGLQHEKSLSKSLSSLQIADLHPNDMKVVSFEEHSNSQALVEADIHTTFLIKKNLRGEWEVVSIRWGDRRWEDARFFSEALNEARQRAVTSDFEKLSRAIEKFQSENKELPSAENIAALNDLLYPHYMTEPVRLDPWSNEYRFQLTSRHSYIILSAGPDRRFGTPDDIRLER